MGQLTLEITATTTVNGAAHNLGGNVSLPVKAYSQQTRDIGGVYEQVTDQAISYLIVCNVGDESLFVQCERSGPAYIPFEVVSGGHGVFPAAISDGAVGSFTRFNIRGATGVGARAIIITITP